jgi:hypothetical protein
MNDSLINLTFEKIRKTLAGDKKAAAAGEKKKIKIQIRKSLAHRCAFLAHPPGKQRD